jgi:hypothetical protein
MTEYRIIIKIKSPIPLPEDVGTILDKVSATAYNHLAAKNIQPDVTAKLTKTIKTNENK